MVRLFRILLISVLMLLIFVSAALRIGRSRDYVPPFAYWESIQNGYVIRMVDLQSGFHASIGRVSDITFIGWTTEGSIALKSNIQDNWTTFTPNLGWQTRSREEAPPSFSIFDDPYAPEKQYLALRGVEDGWSVYRVDMETREEDRVIGLQRLNAYPKVIWAPDENHLMHFRTTDRKFDLRYVNLETETVNIIYSYPFGEISNTTFSADQRWVALRVLSTNSSDLHIVVIDLITGDTHTIAENNPRIHLIGFDPGR